MASGFTFRQRFDLVPGGGLPFPGQVHSLFSANGVVVELKSLEGKPISESTLLSVWGGPFASEAAAAAAGEEWRSAIQRALAGVNVGANFGLRNPNMGGLTDSMIEEIRRGTGVVVYRDSWDVIVFPSDQQPRFSSASATGRVVPLESVAAASFTASPKVPDPVDEVAFDLYAASMRSSHMADVRMVLLVMAVECLLKRSERPEVSRHHLQGLISQTLSNETLEKGERDSIANALRSLKWVSVAKAARTLAQSLDAKDFSADPVQVVPEAFRMRNALVHGGARPDLDRIRYLGAVLEGMVGALIAGDLVAAEVRQARAACVSYNDM